MVALAEFLKLPVQIAIGLALAHFVERVGCRIFGC